MYLIIQTVLKNGPRYNIKYYPLFLENFVIKGYILQSEKKKLTESIKKNISYHLKNKSCPLPIKVDGIKFIFSLRFVMFLEPAYFFSFGSSIAKL
jgi:hypothetical protein